MSTCSVHGARLVLAIIKHPRNTFHLITDPQTHAAAKRTHQTALWKSQIMQLTARALLPPRLAASTRGSYPPGVRFQKSHLVNAKLELRFPRRSASKPVSRQMSDSPTVRTVRHVEVTGWRVGTASAGKREAG